MRWQLSHRGEILDLFASDWRAGAVPADLDALVSAIDALIWDAIEKNENCAHHYGNLTYSCSCAVPVEALREALAARLGHPGESPE